MFLKRIRPARWLAVIIIMIFRMSHAQLQWAEGGLPIASTTAEQVHLSGVADGNGGAFITYERNPSGDSDIYAQWIDQRGNLRWGASGILVCSSGLDQKHPAIIGDGAGGVYVAWQDEGDDNNLYAQHLDADGAPLGTPGGFLVCSAANEQTQVKMVSDEAGGAILFWLDKRNGSTNDIYAQRINGSGNTLWASNGVPVTLAAGNQSSHVVVGDGAGNAYVAWQDYRNGYDNIDIYAQKILSNGSQAWNANGTAVASQTGNQYAPALNTSGTQVMISWQDSRFDYGNIYAQSLDINGTPLWTTNGVPVCEASGTQNNSRIIPDKAGGVIIAWVDNRDYYDIYAQRVNADGNILWSLDGSPVNSSSGLQYAPEMVPDGSGGALVVWNDNRTEIDINIYAQHIDGSGSMLLPEDGFPVSVADTTQQNHILISDDSGGVIAVWQDSRDRQNDIYSQLINDHIVFSVPDSETLWTGGQNYNIQWTHHTTQTRFHHLHITASSTPGDCFPIGIAGNVDPAQTSQSWTPDAINSAFVQVKIQARDLQDSVLCEYISDVFKVDSDPPAAFSLIAPGNGEMVSLTPSFQWETATDNISGLNHYELWIGDTLFQDNLQETELTLNEAQKLPKGYHDWTVKAVDEAGLIRQAVQTWQIEAYEDHDPPDPFDLLTPEDQFWTADTSPQFTWSASADGGSGLAKYQFYLDGQIQVDDIPPSTRSVNSLTLTPGSHTWVVNAVDSLGNTRSSAVRTVQIDNIGPQDFDILTPVDNGWLSDTTPEFTWESAPDTGIGLAEYQLWIDDTLVRDHISGSLSGITLSQGEALAEGTHDWVVKAEDSLGNSKTSQSTYTVGVDITSPSVFTPASPENNSFVNTLSPDLTWNSSVDALSGLMKYELWIDGELNRDNLTETASSPVTALEEGLHTWTVKAWDHAGNSRTSSSFTFTVDTTPPDEFALISPASNAVLHKNRPAFIWETTQDALSGFSKFQFYIDGQIEIDNLAAQDTTVTRETSFENGTYSWKIFAWDKAGNQRISDQIYFTIDCHAPQITSASSVSASEDTPFEYTALATDEDGDDVALSFHQYPSWLTPAGDEISGTPLYGAQDTSFLIVAYDGIYYDSLEVAVTVQSINDPPVLSEFQDQTIDEDSTLAEIPFSIEDEETPPADLLLSVVSSDTLVVSDAGILFGGSGENRHVTLTPAADAFGTTVITITLSDGEKTDEEQFTLTVNAVNDAPVLTGLADQTIEEDSSLFEIPFVIGDVETDADGLILSASSSDTALVSDSQLVFGGQNENRTFSLTPRPDQSGQATITFSVSDGAEQCDVSFMLTILPVNDPPVIVSPDTATAREDEHFVYTASALDVDGPNISIVFRDYPGWLAPAGLEISGTPPNGSESSVFQVIASDGSLSDTLAVNLTFIPVNDPPYFDYEFPEPVFTDMDTLHWQMDLDDYASDPDNPDSTLTWTFDYLEHTPVTVTIDSVTHIATLSGQQVSGLIQIRFSVFDPYGASAADTLKINILQTGVEDDPDRISPIVFELSNNYPNPFNPTTTIAYSIPRTCQVILSVYNLMGQKLETLIDEKHQAGTYEIQWNASQYSSGIYFYRIQADTHHAVKRMVLIK